MDAVADDVARLRPDAVRQVLVGGSLLDATLQAYHDRGLPVLGVLARESRARYYETRGKPDTADGASSLDWIAYYAERYGHLLWGVQVWNEPDGPHGGTSAPLGWEQLNAYLRRAREVFQPLPGSAGTGVRVIAPGLITGQPSVLVGMHTSQLDAIAVHPYWKTGAEIGGFVAAHWAVAHRPVWATECVVSADLLLGLRRSPLVEAAFPYCYQRWPGWPLALVDEQRHPLPLKQEWWRAKEALMADEVADLKAQVASLKQQQAFQTEAIVRILKGEWDNGPGSAEALIRALDPAKYGSFEALPFPK